MQIKAFSMLETLMILFIMSSIGSIYGAFKPLISKKNEIISEIIHTQYQSFQNHKRYDFTHKLVDEFIWFNMSGNVNKAQTISVLGTKVHFTIMLFTGRIHE